MTKKTSCWEANLVLLGGAGACFPLLLVVRLSCTRAPLLLVGMMAKVDSLLDSAAAICSTRP
jgi:hypothetical protein